MVDRRILSAYCSKISVVVRNSFYADPDPTLYFEADPDLDPTFYYDADPVPEMTFYFDTETDPTLNPNWT
jgi:hypothetical protein